MFSEFTKRFSGTEGVKEISAPGRAEIIGNHTDHNLGCVLAAAVDLRVRALVAPNDSPVVNVVSEGFPETSVDLRFLEPMPSEYGTTAGLIRGVASALGCRKGFNAVVRSDVPSGSGLSSSAAFEVLIGRIFNELFFGGSISAMEIAKAGQIAERDFFGKPSGLMDQLASSTGGFVHIDFKDKKNPLVTPLNFDISKTGYSMCVVNTHGSHDGLTKQYGEIPSDMCAVANALGCSFLRETSYSEFERELPRLRRECGDRATLRAMHFFSENLRVEKAVKSLEANDFAGFLACVRESGLSSERFLQNLINENNPREQGLVAGIAISESVLCGSGAVRVHGGGFAGTILSFVPCELLEKYRARLDAVFGEGSVISLGISFN